MNPWIWWLGCAAPQAPMETSAPAVAPASAPVEAAAPPARLTLLDTLGRPPLRLPVDVYRGAMGGPYTLLAGLDRLFLVAGDEVVADVEDPTRFGGIEGLCVGEDVALVVTDRGVERAALPSLERTWWTGFADPGSIEAVHCPDAPTAAAVVTRDGVLWVHGGERMERSTELPPRASAARFAPNGRLLALGLPDGSLALHDWPGGRQVRRLTQPAGASSRPLTELTIDDRGRGWAGVRGGALYRIPADGDVLEATDLRHVDTYPGGHVWEAATAHLLGPDGSVVREGEHHDSWQVVAPDLSHRVVHRDRWVARFGVDGRCMNGDQAAMATEDIAWGTHLVTAGRHGLTVHGPTPTQHPDGMLRRELVALGGDVLVVPEMVRVEGTSVRSLETARLRAVDRSANGEHLVAYRLGSRGRSRFDRTPDTVEWLRDDLSAVASRTVNGWRPLRLSVADDGTVLGVGRPPGASGDAPPTVAKVYAGAKGEVASLPERVLADGLLTASGTVVLAEVVDDGVRVVRLDDGASTELAMVPCGFTGLERVGPEWVAVGRDVGACGDEAGVTVWDVATGRVVAEGAEEGGGALAMTPSPDGSKVAVAGPDGRVRTYQLP